MSKKPAELQASFDYGLLYGCDDAFRASMRPLHDAYEAIGNIVVAGATGIDKADLPKMFEAGSGRHLRFSAVYKIGALASLELRKKALEPLARCWGLGICDAPEPMTDKERADRAETALRMLGPVGEQALAAAYGGRR